VGPIAAAKLGIGPQTRDREVRTVVVRSGTASFLTTAFRAPVAMPVSRMTTYSLAGELVRSAPAPIAVTLAMKSNAASTPNANAVGRWRLSGLGLADRRISKPGSQE